MNQVPQFTPAELVSFYRTGFRDMREGKFPRGDYKSQPAYRIGAECARQKPSRPVDWTEDEACALFEMMMTEVPAWARGV